MTRSPIGRGHSPAPSTIRNSSKIETGQLDIELAPFALRPLVEQAALLYVPEAQRKGVELYYAIHPALEASYISRVHRIRQVIHHLLSNAVKFTDSGRIVVSVSPGDASEAHPCQLRFQVVDSGIGMSEVQLAHLFEPFPQVDAGTSQRFDGPGLGLAQCRQMALLFDGDIDAQSTVGVGSIFTFDLPVMPAPRAGEAPRPLLGRQIALMSGAPEWRSGMGDLLNSWGASVTAMSHPNELTGDASRQLLIVVGEARSWTSEEEAALRASFERTIRARADGPFLPEDHGGETRVSSYVSAALLKAIENQPVVSRPREQVSPSTWNDRGAVLLVEDNPVNRELIRQQLEALGFRVDHAEDGQAALHIWRPDIYVAVLTDINMPIMNGYEFASALRGRGATLPVLAMSAATLASERFRCKEAGIDDLLLKPLTLESLDAALNRRVPIAPSSERGPAATDAGPGATAPARSRRFSEKVRRAFVESGRCDLAVLSEAMDKGDEDTVIDKLHAFKGVLLMLGEASTGNECSTLEAQVIEHGLDDQESALRRLAERLDAAIRRYEEELGH